MAVEIASEFPSTMNKAFRGDYFFEVEDTAGITIRKVNNKTREGIEYHFDKDGKFHGCDNNAGLNYFVREFINDCKEMGKAGRWDWKRVIGTMGIAVPKNHKFRSFDNNVFEERSDGNVRMFRKLNESERREVIDSAYVVAKEAYEILDGNLEQDAVDSLKNILQHNYDTLEKSAGKFKKLYKKLAILPPLGSTSGRYNTMYIEATEGCLYNHCKMCDFYKGIKYREKPMDEFKEHVNQVLEFHKPSINRRYSVFLGAANALAMKTDDVIERLDYVNEEVYRPFILSDNLFPPGYDVTTGILSFSDVKSTLRKGSEDFKEFYKRNLSGVYLGIESGSEETLKFLNKGYTKKEDVLEAVHSIKNGSRYISVGLIFIAGLPGKHFEETADLMKKLPLDYNDSVFLSRLVPTPLMPDVDSQLVEKQMKGFHNVLEEKRKNMELNRYGYSFKVIEYQIKDFFYD